jgi:hypothetical protein
MKRVSNWKSIELLVLLLFSSVTTWADQALNLTNSECGQAGNVIALSGWWGPNSNHCRWKQDGSPDYVTGDLSYFCPTQRCMQNGPTNQNCTTTTCANLTIGMNNSCTGPPTTEVFHSVTYSGGGGGGGGHCGGHPCLSVKP